MATEDDVREVLQKVATAALFYYPEVHVDDPEYTLAKDLDWALGHSLDIPEDVLAALRDLAARTIIDPTRHRRDLFDAFVELFPTLAD